jgi:hypothetical protein
VPPILETIENRHTSLCGYIYIPSLPSKTSLIRGFLSFYDFRAPRGACVRTAYVRPETAHKEFVYELTPHASE